MYIFAEDLHKKYRYPNNKKFFHCISRGAFSKLSLGGQTLHGQTFYLNFLYTSGEQSIQFYSGSALGCAGPDWE